MTKHDLLPDALDMDILREMYRGGAVNIAGVDPRLNASRIAHRLKIGRARVAARLSRWRETGFLRQYDVWLNPAILGWVGAALGVRLANRLDKTAMFRRLSLVDGVVMAIDYLGDWVGLTIVAPDTEELARRVRLIGGLSGVAEVEGPVPWHVPAPRRKLTPLDVRIVRALRDGPTSTLSAIARKVGISTRTMTRRYSALVEDWVVWFVPVFDFTVTPHPVVSMTVTLRPGTAPETVAHSLRERFPLSLNFRSPIARPEVPPEWLAFYVTLPSVAALEELEGVARSLPGVLDVELLVMIRILSFRDWFDRQLDRLTPAVPSAARLHSPQRG